MKNLSKTIQIVLVFIASLIFMGGITLSSGLIEVNSSNLPSLPESTDVADDLKINKKDDCEKKGACNDPVYNNSALVKKGQKFVAPEAKGNYKKDEEVPEDKIKNVKCEECKKCTEVKGAKCSCALFVKEPESEKNKKPEFKKIANQGTATEYVKGADYQCKCQGG